MAPYDLKVQRGRAINTSQDPGSLEPQEKDRLHVKVSQAEDEAIPTKEADLEERIDDSISSRTIYGFAEPIEGLTEVPQTSAVWKIYAIDVVGTQTHKRYAIKDSEENIGFVHKWSERASLFPAVAFENDFSIQLRDTADSWIRVPHSSDIDFANNEAFSYFRWFKTSKTGAQTICQKTSTGAGNNGYIFSIDGSGRPEIEIRGAGTGDRIRVRADSPTVDLRDGSWHLLGFTKSTSLAASGTIIYLDGVAQTPNVRDDSLSGSTNNTEDLYLGAAFNGGTPRCDGNIDEDALFNAALTALEVAEIYNSNNGVIDLQEGSGQISSNLVGYWRMGDGSFAALPDIPDEQGTNDGEAGTDVKSGDIESEVPP